MLANSDQKQYASTPDTMSRLEKIDTHTHCVPPFWVEEVKKAGKGPIIVKPTPIGIASNHGLIF